MARKNDIDNTFVDRFEAEVAQAIELHNKAAKASQELVDLKMEIVSMEAKVIEAANNKQSTTFVQLQREADNLKTRLREIEGPSQEVISKDDLTRQKAMAMEEAFLQELRKADEEDVRKMLPLIAELRKIARESEARNGRASQAIRELYIAVGIHFYPTYYNDICKGVRAVVANKKYRTLTGEDVNVSNPQMVEL